MVAAHGINRVNKHIHTHTHTHTTAGFFPSYVLLTDRQPSQLSPAFFFLERGSCLPLQRRRNSPRWDPNHSITPEDSNTAPLLLKKKKKKGKAASLLLLKNDVS